MRNATTLIFSLALLTSLAFGQQDYVTRYDAYVGYAFLDSPGIGLFQNGVHFQAGVRPKTWYSLGFDYTFASGDLTLTPDLLTTSLQQRLGAQLQQLAAAGQLPPGFKLAVPTHADTQTFTAGIQFSYRHFSKLTLFLRPDIGAIREVAKPHPRDPISAGVVAQLVPSGEKTDWTAFWGFGGGGDVILSKHLSIRVQSDLVWNHLFNDLLKNGRWTTRFSIGPAFNFGPNIVK